MWGDPSQPEALPSTDFDVVIDNNGKTLEVCKPLIDAFKVRFCNAYIATNAENFTDCCIGFGAPWTCRSSCSWEGWQASTESSSMQGKVQHYMFVSSAGAYNANSVEPMHVEGDPRKSSAGKMPTACDALFCIRFSRHFVSFID